ncbi:MAG: ABC transporter permease, partial [Sphingobacteriales bacterium]
MFQHFLLVASRNLFKRKFYSLINILGLAIGMTCCIVIGLYVQNELSFDRYHVKHERIYRVLQTFRSTSPGQKLNVPSPKDFQVWGCAPVGPALKTDFAQEAGDKRMQQENIVAIDSNAFKLFSWKLLQGDPRTALAAPNSIVLTQQVAEKFFGNTNIVGKTMRVNNGDNLIVTGVVANVPPNSQITFNGLLSMSTIRKSAPDMFTWWGYVDFYTYFLLKDHADITAMTAAIPAFLQRHNPNDTGYTMAFEPMDDAYLHSKAARQPGPVGSMLNIYLFSCVGFIILLIACVNFMNLSTARSLERAKEVGVRKVLGVSPWALRRQFLFESFILALVAAIIALVISKFSLPFVSDLSGKNFSPNRFISGQLVLWMGLLVLITGLLAGAYPAWFLSRFRPVAVLKGAVKPSGSSLSLRKGLVVFQFALSVALIAGTIIVNNELQYLKRHDLGFKKEQVLVINFEGDDQVTRNIEAIKQSIAGQPGVSSVAASRAVPGEFLPNAGTSIQGADGNMVQKIPLIYEIDFDFLSCLDIPVIAGRGYSRAFPADSTQSMIINESAAKL